MRLSRALASSGRRQFCEGEGGCLQPWWRWRCLCLGMQRTEEGAGENWPREKVTGEQAW